MFLATETSKDLLDQQLDPIVRDLPKADSAGNEARFFELQIFSFVISFD
jgi:hypothetical protein